MMKSKELEGKKKIKWIKKQINKTKNKKQRNGDE